MRLLDIPFEGKDTTAGKLHPDYLPGRVFVAWEAIIRSTFSFEKGDSLFIV